MLMNTDTSCRSASARSRSRSRRIRAPLVMIDSGCRRSSSNSSTARVERNLRSAGWYGSVLPPMCSTLQT